MKRIIMPFLIVLFLSVIFSGCSKSVSKQTGADNIKSYQDIPGITQEEKSAIEKLKAEKASFSYGHLLETESFMLPDGTFAGSTIKVCELLSELFGVEFVPLYCEEWDILKSGLDNREIDFTGCLTPTEERKKIYSMSEPIAGRDLKIYSSTDLKEIKTEADLEGLRIGFMDGTISKETFMEKYAGLSFETVDFFNLSEAVEMLETGEIDAFIEDSTIDLQFDDYDFIRSRNLFHPLYNQVSITTGNSELASIISVIDKYLANGGIDKMIELYDEGKFEYEVHKLSQTFTDEEKAYLADLTARNATVNIALENDNYPFSFYNAQEKEFEGIVPEVLEQVAKLTGIRFENMTTEATTFTEMTDKLRTGEISMISHLIYSDERAKHYIWSSVPYAVDNYVLISKSDVSPVKSYRIPMLKIGTFRGSAYEEAYNEWFLDNDNLVLYGSASEAFDALEKGDIDFVMGADYTLSAQTNFREKTGYIINYRFDSLIESKIGFNKDEVILCSIVDKAQKHIEIEAITNYWNSCIFDYSRKMSQQRITYISFFAFAMFLMMIGISFLFLKNKRMGKGLLERTAKLSAIYTSIPDTLFTKNTKGVYTSCNPSFEIQAGMSEADIIGKTYAEVFKKRVCETVETYREIDKKVLNERSMETVEETVLFPDGSHKLLETLKAPLVQNGNVIGLLGIGRDVTEHKEIEDKLQQALVSVQENLVMFQNTVNTAQIAFVMSVDNIISQVNEYSSSYIGMSVGDDIRSFYTDPMQRDEIIETLEHDYMIPSITIRFGIANGESHRFRSSIANIQYNKKKTLILWAMDIEDDEFKNDQIRSMQESLQTILDTLPVPVRIFDMETTEIVYVNDSLLELLEYDSVDELCGLKMHDVLSEIQSDGTSSRELENKIRDSVAADPVSIELEYRSKTGKIIEALVVTRLIDYKGRPSSIGIIKDLTEEKERAKFLLNAAEREREANQSKSQFLANMSHEIRTPMNALIVMSELLLNESLTNRQHGYVNDINISAHSLLTIINDILDLSKIEAGKLELSLIDYDFNMFLDNICSIFKFTVQNKGLEFKFETDGIIPKCLFGDDVRLRQVLTNICGNAVKFTSRGFVRLKVIATDKTLMFEIEDTGMGIRKEDLPKLFDAFTQVDTQKNRSIKGTGLGLSISKAFVKMMEGTISVDSVYGQGTVFRVVIPKVAGDESAIVYQDKRGKSKSFFAPSAKVLVVDDNELNLKVAKELLNLHKINADTTFSGREAIDLITERDYDIVFMDHMMPEMDGIETTSEIRKLGGKYKQMTIIALTANAIRGAKEMFLSNDFNGFIPKPIDVDVLADTLLEWLPREKIEMQTETTMQENVSEHNGDILDYVKKINAINVDIGLSRVYGIESIYLKTLEIFVKGLLIECKKMENFLSNKDLHNLCISVHGIKSSLSTIGAMELSEAAFVLETASKSGELDYCNEHLPEFLKNLHFLYEQLSVIIPKEEITAEGHPEGNMKYLREHAQAAINAADDLDDVLALDEIKKLQGYDFGTQINESLKNAADEIKDFEFSSTVNILNRIINT